MKDKGTGTNRPLILVSTIVLIAVAACGLAVHFKQSQHYMTLMAEQLAKGSSRQVNPIRRLGQARLAMAEARLRKFVETRNATGPGQVRQFGEFALVARLEQIGSDMNVAWIEKGPSYEAFRQGADPGAPALTIDEELVLLKSIQLSTQPSEEFQWVRLADNRGRPVWALVVASDSEGSESSSGQRTFSVGFFARNPVSTVIDTGENDGTQVVLFDAKGYVAAHSNSELIGALLRDQPLVRDVLKARLPSGLVQFQTEGISWVAAFEKLDRSNLYVAVQAPLALPTVASTQDLVLSVVFAFALGVFLIFSWGTRILPPVQVGGPSLSADQLNAERVSASEEVSGPRSDGEPRAIIPEPRAIQAEVTSFSEFLRRFNSGFVEVFKPPLLSAIAQLRLARVKLESEANDGAGSSRLSVLEHFEALERDLTELREVVLTVETVAAQSSESPAKANSELMPLRKLVETWKSQSPSIRQAQDEGVAFDWVGISRLHDQSVPREAFTKMLDALIDNARLALRGRDRKSLKFSVEPSQNQSEFCIVVADNGIGMDRSVVKRAVEPFFTQFASSGAKGLGLTLCSVVAERLGGRVELNSQLGEGTTVRVALPGVLFPEFVESPESTNTHHEKSRLEADRELVRPSVQFSSLDFDSEDGDENADQWEVNRSSSIHEGPST